MRLFSEFILLGKKDPQRQEGKYFQFAYVVLDKNFFFDTST